MRLLLTVTVIVVGSLVLAGDALAQPRITDLDGTARHDLQLILQGIEFGEKTQGAPLRWDDFQDGTDGARMIDRNEPGGGVFNLQAAETRRPTYSTGRQRVAGDMCALQDYSERNNKMIGVTGVPFDRLYVSFWAYRDDYAGTAMRCTNCKLYGNFAESWTGMMQSRWDEYWADDSGHIYFTDCGNNVILNNWSPPVPNLNRWIRVERYIDLGSPNTADGYVAGWVDLNLIGDGSGVFRGNGCESADFEIFLMGHYFRTEDGSGALLRQYVSEMYVDTTPARVEIGNADTWAGCTHREIQIPDSWSSGMISVTLNTGTFDEGSQAWLYVVDDSGQASDGFPVTIGGTYGGGGDDGIPGAPGVVGFSQAGTP